MILLSVHYVSSTFLSIPADPSNADFWIKIIDVSNPEWMEASTQEIVIIIIKLHKSHSVNGKLYRSMSSRHDDLLDQCYSSIFNLCLSIINEKQNRSEDWINGEEQLHKRSERKRLCRPVACLFLLCMSKSSAYGNVLIRGLLHISLRREVRPSNSNPHPV